MPATDAEKTANLYFRWRKAHGNPIHRRHVRVVVRFIGDPLEPQNVCRRMVEEDRVFLLMGFGFHNPDARCALVARRRGVPYLSAGFGKRGIAGPSYFATSLAWRAQGPLLANYLIEKKQAKNRRVGAVYLDDRPYRGAGRSFVRAMEEVEAPVDYERMLPPNANKSDADTVVQEMKAAGVELVFVLTSPIFFTQLLDSAAKQLFDPLWSGGGYTMTRDSVAEIGCRSGSDGFRARFFSPVPPVNNSSRFDPRFRRAVKRFGEGPPTTNQWNSWAAAKMLARMLERAGRDLTRRGFVASLERSGRFRNQITPTLDYSSRDHFGAEEVHLLRVDCSKRRWKTVRAFVNDF